MAVTLTMASCNKPSSVDTSSFQKSFKSAEAAVQTGADKVITAVKSADYAGALTELKALANNAKLTPEQQQAIKDLMTQVENAIKEAATKAADEAGKALKEVPKALPK